MKLSIKILFAFVVLYNGNLLAQQNISSTLQQVKSRIDQAYFTQQPEILDSVISELQKLDDSGELQKYVHYYSALAYFRLYPLPLTDDSHLYSKNLDMAQTELERAVELDPDFADAYALLCGVYGMKASGMFSGIKYGKKANQALAKAQKLDPQNPRMYLIDGMGNYYKPKLFGGGIVNAQEAILTSLNLFESHSSENEIAPDWGKAEAHAWLANIFFSLNNNEKSHEHILKALTIAPNFVWVNEELLPQIGR